MDFLVTDLFAGFLADGLVRGLRLRFVIWVFWFAVSRVDFVFSACGFLGMVGFDFGGLVGWVCLVCACCWWFDWS